MVIQFKIVLAGLFGPEVLFPIGETVIRARSPAEWCKMIKHCAFYDTSTPFAMIVEHIVRQIEVPKSGMFTYHIVGQFHFGFILHVPLRLVSIFLNVGRVEISCGLLPTRFSTMLL